MIKKPRGLRKAASSVFVTTGGEQPRSNTPSLGCVPEVGSLARLTVAVDIVLYDRGRTKGSCCRNYCQPTQNDIKRVLFARWVSCERISKSLKKGGFSGYEMGDFG